MNLLLIYKFNLYYKKKRTKATIKIINSKPIALAVFFNFFFEGVHNLKKFLGISYRIFVIFLDFYKMVRIFFWVSIENFRFY